MVRGRRTTTTASRSSPSTGSAFWVCPGTSTWNSLFPRLENSALNIARYAESGRRHGAEGLLVTDWGDFGHYNPLGNSWWGYAWAAQQAWSGDAPAPRFDRAFARCLFGDASGETARRVRALGGIHDGGFAAFNGSPLQFLYFDELERGFFIDGARPASLRRTLRQLDRELPRLRAARSRFRRESLTWQEMRLALDASRHAVRKALAGQRYLAWRAPPGAPGQGRPPESGRRAAPARRRTETARTRAAAALAAAQRAGRLRGRAAPARALDREPRPRGPRARDESAARSPAAPPRLQRRHHLPRALRAEQGPTSSGLAIPSQRQLVRVSRGSIGAGLGWLLLLMASPADARAELPFQTLDRHLLVLRACLAGATLGWLVWSAWLGRSGRAQRWSRSRRAALALLATVAFCANFNFFAATSIHKHEFFHYYLGAKFSPELGYYGIYRCSVAAAFEQGFEERDPLFRVTDLRDNDVRMYWAIAPRSPRCDGAFSPARWEAFKTDIARFRELLGTEWRRVLLDHGFNPTPIWTLIARPLTALFPVEMSSLWILARLDLALILILLAGIGWAFGFEAACLAAIAWGANPHTRYQWIGDAFLRNIWLSASMLGLCLLRKGRYRGAGALLTLSSLLRIFPALFVFGYLVRQLRSWLGSGSPDPGFRRFLVSSLVTGLLLVVGGAAAAGRGPGVYFEFSRRISALTEFIPNNGVGLRHLLSYTSESPKPEVIDGVSVVRMYSIQKLRREALEGRSIVYFGVMAGFLALFWRASRSRAGLGGGGVGGGADPGADDARLLLPLLRAGDGAAGDAPAPDRGPADARPARLEPRGPSLPRCRVGLRDQIRDRAGVLPGPAAGDAASARPHQRRSSACPRRAACLGAGTGCRPRAPACAGRRAPAPCPRAG